MLNSGFQWRLRRRSALTIAAGLILLHADILVTAFTTYHISIRSVVIKNFIFSWTVPATGCFIFHSTGVERDFALFNSTQALHGKIPFSNLTTPFDDNVTDDIGGAYADLFESGQEWKILKNLLKFLATAEAPDFCSSFAILDKKV